MRIDVIRHKMLYFVAALLVVDFILFGYGPSITRLKSLKHAQKAHQQIMSNSIKQNQKLVDLRKQVQSMNRDIEQWEVRIPHERELGKTIKKLSQLMSQYQLVDQQITPGIETQSDELGVIPVTLECRGDMQQLFEFYRDLQADDRLIRIQEISLQKKNDRFGGILMKTELMLFYGNMKILSQAS